MTENDFTFEYGPRTLLALETQDWDVQTYREHILELRAEVERLKAQMEKPTAPTPGEALLDDLALRLAGAKNYLYEGTMSDYSMESIRRGEIALNEILGIIHGYGLMSDQLVEWSDERGLWIPIKNEGDRS